MFISKQILTLSVFVVFVSTAVTARFAMAHQDSAQSDKPAAIRISGAVEKPGEWTPEQIKTEFAADIKSVSYTLKGVKGEAKCLPLITLIQAAKLKLSAKPKNHELAVAVVVMGRDGYAACFSYGELQTQIGKRAVWIAMDRSGKPLPEAGRSGRDC